MGKREKGKKKWGSGGLSSQELDWVISRHKKGGGLGLSQADGATLIERVSLIENQTAIKAKRLTDLPGGQGYLFFL